MPPVLHLPCEHATTQWYAFSTSVRATEPSTMVSKASWKSYHEALAMEERMRVQRAVRTAFVASVVGLVRMAW